MITMLLMEITDSTFVAPGVSLATFAGLMAAGAKWYKEARQIDVEGERNRRIAAEAREKESGTATSAQVRELMKKVDSLEEAIENLRTEHERDLLAERGKNFSLRMMLKDHGIDIPKELGP